MTITRAVVFSMSSKRYTDRQVRCLPEGPIVLICLKDSMKNSVRL